MAPLRRRFGTPPTFLLSSVLHRTLPLAHHASSGEIWTPFSSLAICACSLRHAGLLIRLCCPSLTLMGCSSLPRNVDKHGPSREVELRPNLPPLSKSFFFPSPNRPLFRFFCPPSLMPIPVASRGVSLRQLRYLYNSRSFCLSVFSTFPTPSLFASFFFSPLRLLRVAVNSFPIRGYQESQDSESDTILFSFLFQRRGISLLSLHPDHFLGSQPLRKKS